jgi:thioredoxin-related protein
VILISTSLSGGDYDDIDWADSYKEALHLAKANNKYVMVLITSKRCKWCKKLKRKTLSSDPVIEKLNSKFVSVEVTRRKDEYPHRKLRARAVPTTYFLTPDGRAVMRPVIGYWNRTNYLSYLDDVDRKIRRLEKK